MAPIADALIRDPDRYPRPASETDADRGLAQWAEAAAAEPALAAVADDPLGRRLLCAVFGNSPYLTRLLLSDPGYATFLFDAGPDAALARALDAMRAEPPGSLDTAALMRTLRRAKRQASLAIGLADVAESWGGAQVTVALSSTAETALKAATAHLLSRAHAANDLRLAHPDDPERDSGLIVLGMGKLGACELNYSSDIDLVILYDHERTVYTGKDSLSRCMVRLARELVRVMEERTGDGYVFRTDLRLRPDPASTPLAVSVIAAETYYESTGQNWERAAMIKARPVAGDLAAGRRFVDYLRPFLWRRNLDFAAIQDIHSIKRQINAHKGGAAIAIRGHNVKLGRGGIREIEFFAQTQQLIWGGRDPALRLAQTCPALERLATAGHITSDVAARLTYAYWFLRRLEHRLQMADDQQTHTLPEDDAGLDRIAAFMGFADAGSFCGTLESVLRLVEEEYAHLFEEAPDLSGPGNLVFTGADDDPETLNTLTGLGYQAPSTVAAVVRGWHHGRYRATRSTRAKEILTELMPSLLAALGRTADPDAALRKFDEFLAGLPAGVQLFSLLHSRPGLLDLLAAIMGSTPRLAEWLSRYPALLDAILGAGGLDPDSDPASLDAEVATVLEQARDFQDVLDGLRRWNSERIFRIGVRMIEGSIDPETAGTALAGTADAVLRAVLPAVERDFARQHGRIPGAGIAIIAFGKLGGREMMVGSDLDLVFVYDAGDAAEASDGARPLTPGHYYSRLSHRLIGAITAPTAEGKLYEVDMRLRPSGNAGPIASALAAFAQYHQEAAWTWEHMALTRARVVAGPPGLARRIDSAVRAALAAPRDADKLVRDVADMRARMARELKPKSLWDVKHLRGGLVDVEFIAQYLQLRHAAERPEILSTNTSAALARLADAGFLEPGTAQELIAAVRLWRQVQGILRLSLTGDFDEASAPEGLKRLLARASGAVDFMALRDTITATAESAHAHFVRLIEAPAAEQGRT
ncbi:MAG: bifunctional [glutamine synthetase] adenylyltransferase/[glutamine synthetase]-adenylyl-L-tyrosine phosphorylase [Rhodospirillaceae bacterium]